VLQSGPNKNHASITHPYIYCHTKRITDLEICVKRSLLNFDDLPAVTERINKIAEQCTWLTQVLKETKVSSTTPTHPDHRQQVEQWQRQMEE
jgi:hypothetical protein